MLGNQGLLVVSERDISWRRLCNAATLELDRVKLHKRIEAAHAAMQQRLKEQANNHDGTPAEEQRAIAEAMHDLAQLQRVTFRSSDPASQ
jgi:hypothetical protein